jgi:hypothetical protein
VWHAVLIAPSCPDHSPPFSPSFIKPRIASPAAPIEPHQPSSKHQRINLDACETSPSDIRNIRHLSTKPSVFRFSWAAAVRIAALHPIVFVPACSQCRVSRVERSTASSGCSSRSLRSHDVAITHPPFTLTFVYGKTNGLDVERRCTDARLPSLSVCPNPSSCTYLCHPPHDGGAGE